MNKIDTCRLVMQDIEARRTLGINTYGVPLAPHNGRNSLQDAYEECLDMAMYLKNEMLENGIKSECGTNQDGVEKLSNRVRSNSEAAPWVIGEIRNLESNLEAAVSEAIEQARLNGIGAEREAALMAKLEAAERERDALRAKVERMEKQAPVAWAATNETGRVVEALGFNKSKRFDTPLCFATSAKGE